MTTIINIKNIIEIEEKYINENLLDKIKEKLKSFPCSSEYGYIKEIKEIKEIESLPLNRYFTPTFKVTSKALVLKPVIDMILKCKISFINTEGIIVQHDDLKIFVKKNNKFDIIEDTGKEIYKKYVILLKNKRYTISDEINTKINVVDYKNHQFKCLGDFV